MITLILGLLVRACGIVDQRSQHGQAAKIAGAIGLVAAAVIGCYDVAAISNAAVDVPELDQVSGRSAYAGGWPSCGGPSPGAWPSSWTWP